MGKYTGAKGEDFKNKYAIAAMNASRRQFHDAHPLYSKIVLETLNQYARLIGKPKDTCPVCGEKHDKVKPPYGLVSRIDFISREHKKLITKMKKTKLHKYVQLGYFTSTRVKQF